MFSLQDIVLDYGPLKVLERFNLNCDRRQFMCLFGPSGVGKTSILNILAVITKPQAGLVRCDHRRLAYVFQEPRLVPWLTVEQNLELGLHAQGLNARQRRQRVEKLLPLLGLDGFAAYYPGQLSGGMKQRVSIGRAFAIQPDLLLLDEPFSSLDANLKQDMQELLASLRQWHSCTTVMVTHDEKEAINLSDRIVVLHGRPCRAVLELVPDKEQISDFRYARSLEAAILDALKHDDSPACRQLS